jgi:hypothetical protein
MSKGSLEFSSDNHISFIVDTGEDVTEADAAEHMLEWNSDPKKFAAAMRAAADWLDAHADKKIIAEID